MSASPPLEPTAEQPIPVIRAEESALAKLMSSGEDIVVSVNQALLRVGQLLSDDNVRHVSETLSNIDKLVSTVAGQRDNLGEAVAQLADASKELKGTLKTLNEMAHTTNALVRDEARAVLQSTDQTIASIERVAKSTEALLNDNRAALSSFSEQGLRQVAPALAELRETLHAYKQLGEQLGSSNSLLLGRDQPKEYTPK